MRTKKAKAEGVVLRCGLCGKLFRVPCARLDATVGAPGLTLTHTEEVTTEKGLGAHVKIVLRANDRLCDFCSWAVLHEVTKQQLLKAAMELNRYLPGDEAAIKDYDGLAN